MVKSEEIVTLEKNLSSCICIMGKDSHNGQCSEAFPASAFTNETKDLCFLDVKVQVGDDRNRFVSWTERDVKSLDCQEGHSRLRFLFFEKPEVRFCFF